MARNPTFRPIASLYADVTDRIIRDLEGGCLPWVQPWDGCAPMGMPRNAATGRPYSGINILLLWKAMAEGGYASQRWMTYRQAQAIGGQVRKGAQGTTVVYADRFTPRGAAGGATAGGPGSEPAPGEGGDEARRSVAFLKRFTVFNVEQIDALPLGFRDSEYDVTRDREPVPEADALIAATGADIRIGGGEAYYHPEADYIRVPPQQAFRDQINWYRTALHELGHWTGHRSRLARLVRGMDGDAYGREELVAEMSGAFVCAELGIVPTVRHADYIGAWLAILRADNKAIFRAASQASKAADYLLALRDTAAGHGAPVKPAAAGHAAAVSAGEAVA